MSELEKLTADLEPKKARAVRHMFDPRQMHLSRRWYT
jgi:hypothetical protein